MSYLGQDSAEGIVNDKRTCDTMPYHAMGLLAVPPIQVVVMVINRNTVGQPGDP